jgi:hypothetical protein
MVLGDALNPWPIATAAHIGVRDCEASRGLAMRRDRSDRNLRNLRSAVALAEIVLLAAWLTIGLAPSAQALPSFARQTGQPCGTCHTDFPALTPFGRRFKLLGYDFVYGITANNNPTVQDLWNTTPAWSFPYAVSSFFGPQAPGTVIEGTFAAHVGGVGAYTMINDLLYLEVTGYKTLGFSEQNALGTDPFGAPGLLGGVAPYWRVALEPNWGPHTLMIGTFGMYSEIHNWLNVAPVGWSTAVDTLSDKFTDIGFDGQYQYQGTITG